MKLSYFTCATPDWTHSEAVEKLAAQGWDGIEWRVVDDPGAETPGFWRGNRATWPLTGLEDSIEQIKSLTSSAGLEMSGIGAYARSHDHEAVDRVLAATAALGAGQVRITVGPVGEDESYPDVFARTKQDWAHVAERAAHHGVKALLELHHKTITASSSSALRLLDGLDPNHVGVIHDSGNMINEGWERPLWTAQLLGPYLAHVHVKNGLWRKNGTDEQGADVYEFGWATLREGQVDLAAYIAELRAGGYDGWITCEDFSTDLPLDERSADNLAYLRAITA